MNSVDIARIAGVSRSTVSRVINNYPNVPEETRKKIEKIIEEYNYVPHASARILAGKHNNVIGLFILEISKTPKDYRISYSPYYAPFLSAAVDNISNLEYNVLVSIISRNKDYTKIKELFINKSISGGIFIGCKNNEPEIEKLIQLGFKVTIIDQEIHNGESAFNNSVIVNVDNLKGGYEATKYLIHKGHRDIAHISGDKAKLSGLLRLMGYKKALEDYGIQFKNSNMVGGDFTEESGYIAAQRLFSKRRPSAIFAANDLMAIGAIKYIQTLNLSIPQDVSIVGFDDIEIARYFTPALTTVKMDTIKMAEIAVKGLINSIEDSNSRSMSYVVPVEIVERSSTMQI